jgi:putative Holliday junction resolvase
MVIERGADRLDDHRRIAALVAEHGARCVVVGLPISLDGSYGPAARAALDEVAQLRSVLDVPVETADERFTTVTASKRLRDVGKTGRRQAAVIDAAAAAVLLQSWLDGPGGSVVRFEER